MNNFVAKNAWKYNKPKVIQSKKNYIIGKSVNYRIAKKIVTCRSSLYLDSNKVKIAKQCLLELGVGTYIYNSSTKYFEFYFY